MKSEFRTYIFEESKPPEKLPYGLIFAVLVGIIILNYVSDFKSNWINFFAIAGLGFLNWYWKYGGFKYGGHLDLNGYYSDEMIMDCEGVKIGAQEYPLSEISSISITYNDVHGARGWNMIYGNFKTNGESNEIIIKMNDGTVIRKYFKLASRGHLKELLRLTVVLKHEVTINNNWQIRRPMNLMK